MKYTLLILTLFSTFASAAPSEFCHVMKFWALARLDQLDINPKQICEAGGIQPCEVVTKGDALCRFNSPTGCPGESVGTAICKNMNGSRCQSQASFGEGLCQALPYLDEKTCVGMGEGEAICRYKYAESTWCYSRDLGEALCLMGPHGDGENCRYLSVGDGICKGLGGSFCLGNTEAEGICRAVNASFCHGITLAEALCKGMGLDFCGTTSESEMLQSFIESCGLEIK